MLPAHKDAQRPTDGAAVGCVIKPPALMSAPLYSGLDARAGWECEHSNRTRGDCDLVWGFLTEMSHHVEAEQPIFQRIELDGPSLIGMSCRDITSEFCERWRGTGVRKQNRLAPGLNVDPQTITPGGR
jgi:hypothetical protein